MKPIRTEPEVDMSLAAGEPEEAARRLLAYAQAEIAALPEGPPRARWALVEAAMTALVGKFEEHHATPERRE